MGGKAFVQTGETNEENDRCQAGRCQHSRNCNLFQRMAPQRTENLWTLATAAPKPVAVDLGHYRGTWLEIRRMPTLLRL
ncbi:hypothetical protein AYO27_20500 [Rhizobium sp. GHKF11]|nr:hypothetical protein AYO27_20500 [Rhizobium sp. GHKF11]